LKALLRLRVFHHWFSTLLLTKLHGWFCLAAATVVPSHVVGSTPNRKMHTCFSQWLLLAALAVGAIDAAEANARFAHNAVGWARAFSNDTVAPSTPPPCLLCGGRELCCYELRLCCSTVCCNADQDCDFNGNCIDPSPPKPTKRLLWANYLGTITNPLVINGTMYIVSSGYATNMIHAFNMTNGSALWSYALDVAAEFSVGLTHGDGMLFGVSNSAVVGLDTSGALRWKLPIANADLVSGPVQFANGHLVFTTVYSIRVLNARTGELSWKITNPEFAPNAVLFEDLFVTSNGNGTSGYRWDGNGKATWTNNLVVPRQQTPILSTQDTVIVLNAMHNTTIVGISMRDGSTVWQMSFSAIFGLPTLYGTRLYLVSPSPDVADADVMWSINADTGNVEWSLAVPNTNGDPSPVAPGGAVDAAIFQDNLYAYLIASGSMQWNVSAFVDSTDSTATKDVLYTGYEPNGATNVTLAAVDLVDGAVAWSFAVQDQCNTVSLVETGGQELVVAACDDGFVYVLRSD
jgi:hypothetical protein